MFFHIVPIVSIYLVTNDNTQISFQYIHLISTFIMQSLAKYVLIIEAVVMHSLWDWKPFQSCFLFVRCPLTLSVCTNFTKVARLGLKIIAIIRSNKSKQQKHKNNCFHVLNFFEYLLNLSYIYMEMKIATTEIFVWNCCVWNRLAEFFICRLYDLRISKLNLQPQKVTQWSLREKLPHYCWIY